MNKLRKIVQMLSEHASQNSICNEVSVSKRRVSACKKRILETSHSYEALLDMSDKELQELLEPANEGRKPNPRRESLEVMMTDIMARLKKRYSNVQLVYDDYYHKLFLEFPKFPKGYGYTHTRSSRSMSMSTRLRTTIVE